DFEETYSIQNFFSYKEKLSRAIPSVDFYQLKGYYLSFDFQHDSGLSHLLFFLKEGVKKFVEEFNNIPKDLIVD
ncbi:30480_t:CDS:1, partial [Racocetra persica]